LWLYVNFSTSQYVLHIRPISLCLNCNNTNCGWTRRPIYMQEN
jgi:hypothetical protein